MFNSGNDKKSIPVILRLQDGRSMSGNILIAMSSDLPRTLNGEGCFIEFETVNGDRSFIAKMSICEAIPNEIPKVRKLETGTDSDQDFNPYRILKIAPGSDIKTVRDAFVSRARLYHPDRFSTVELPEEMARYAQNMSRLINAAYKTLCAGQCPDEDQQERENSVLTG